MELLQGVSYFYTAGGQQVGPVDGTQVIELAQQGQIGPDDHLWAEGFAEWIPAASFDQLAPLYQASQGIPQAPAGLPEPAGAGGEKKMVISGASGPRHVVKRQLDVKPKRRFRQESSFGKLMFFLGLSLILFGVGAYFSPPLEMPAMAEKPPPQSDKFELIVVFSMIGCLLCLLIYSILSLIYLGRAWSYLQELPVARTTPGKAVGYLFIPFFGLYWLFVAYAGWAADHNKFIDMTRWDDAPRGNEGLAITYCVLAILMFPFLHPFVMYNICRGSNYLARSPRPEVEFEG